MSEFKSYTTPPPLRGLPGFLKDTQKMVEETGSATGGVAAMFEQANISVVVDGETSAWELRGQGSLFVGDHRLGIEYVPLLAMFGSREREDVRFVAKPFSMQARIMASLALLGPDLTLPVIPGTLAKDRDNKLNRDLYWRIRQGNNLPTKQELRKLNTNTLQDSATLVANGHVVALYPAGGVMDAMEAVATWPRPNCLAIVRRSAGDNYYCSVPF